MTVYGVDPAQFLWDGNFNGWIMSMGIIISYQFRILSITISPNNDGK
jgi:hypothetical protein